MNISTPYIKENNNDENYIPLAKPSITKKEIDYVNEAMINGLKIKVNLLNSLK